MNMFEVDFSNPVNIAVLSCLGFFSLLSWAIIFSKVLDLLELRKIIKHQEELLHYCQKTEWKQWHKKLVKQNKSGFFLKLYDQVQEMINRSKNYDSTINSNLNKYLLLFLEEEERHRIQGLSWLATIANVSPYVGLLGTLAGVMHTFTLMNEQNLILMKLAPGLAEALQATAIGLLVAIPANIAYNKFTASYRSSLQKLASQGEYLLLHVDASFRNQPAFE
ncbi:MotA/TolQ/ExbB proton channel family protein [bacterium]|jgi:biopolymer transport protein ExbB/TolQ|nr:MotA/TolQ/ExbB proton channel family protein [bacterium]NBX72551.1 MotA/TolQ/ExbB proton channel family protein [bacterium]